MVKLIANDAEDVGSVWGRVIPNILKMVLQASLINAQYYKVYIKGKWNNPRKIVEPFPTPLCSIYCKEIHWVTLNSGHPTNIYIYMCVCVCVCVWERERERERKRVRVCVCLGEYVYVHVCVFAFYKLLCVQRVMSKTVQIIDVYATSTGNSNLLVRTLV